MSHSKVILTPDELIEPKAIMEDNLPRNGGLWPEYAHTMFLCVDSFCDGLAVGHLHSYCFSQAIQFNSIDQVLSIAAYETRPIH